MRSLLERTRCAAVVLPVAKRLTFHLQFVLCMCSLAHCFFALYLLLTHVFVSQFPPPLCVFELPFKTSNLPAEALSVTLLSGVACRCAPCPFSLSCMSLMVPVLT